ncbi:MAG TPA: hypothetical protein VGK99_06570 [Acidobacteriota bacterium]
MKASTLPIDGLQVDWEAGGVKQDRVIFGNASALVQNLLQNNRFTFDTTPGQNSFRENAPWGSLEITLRADGRIDVDIDLGNPSMLRSLIPHLAELINPQSTNPFAVYNVLTQVRSGINPEYNCESPK